MRYAILLRGVNVGGRHKLPKAEFKLALEEMGFSDVVIYLNSGNAVISSHQAPQVSQVQAALEEKFAFPIPTLILPADKIIAIAEAIPSHWTNDPPNLTKEGQKSDVLYLFNQINSPETLQKIGHRPEIETMLYLDGAILANISRRNQGRSSLLKLMSTKLYSQMTVRNINTARALAELITL